MTKLRCCKCKRDRPSDCFWRNRTKARGYDSYCKDCRKIARSTDTAEGRTRRSVRDRATRIQRDHGLTIADVDQMRKKQNNTCALCRAQLGVAHKFDVPSRGKLRGILCKQCSEKVDGMSAEDAKVILGSTKEKSLVRLASYVLGV